jgi:plastocyanin
MNKDPFPHTATAKGAFDSGSIGADASWTWVADKTGTFDYLCTLHPVMKAQLVVR